MTDGNNEWYDWADGVPGQRPPTAPPTGVPAWTADGDADFTGYGRLKSNTLGLNATQSAMTTNMNTWMSQMCTGDKAEGHYHLHHRVQQFEHSGNQGAAPELRVLAWQLFPGPTGADLQKVFRSIGSELSTLQIAQ